MADAKKKKETPTPESPGAFINRELSWLQFARRVLEMAGDPTVPLLERVKFSGILGMLHDEFFMKRVAGLKRQVNKGVDKVSLDGMTPAEELAACRKEVLRQSGEPGWLFRSFARALAALDGGYRWLLARSLRHKLVTLGVGAAAVVGGCGVASTLPWSPYGQAVMPR